MCHMPRLVNSLDHLSLLITALFQHTRILIRLAMAKVFREKSKPGASHLPHFYNGGSDLSRFDNSLCNLSWLHDGLCDCLFDHDILDRVGWL
jgi:hypothetical protein